VAYPATYRDHFFPPDAMIQIMRSTSWPFLCLRALMWCPLAVPCLEPALSVLMSVACLCYNGMSRFILPIPCLFCLLYLFALQTIGNLKTKLEAERAKLLEAEEANCHAQAELISKVKLLDGRAALTQKSLPQEHKRVYLNSPTNKLICVVKCSNGRHK